MEAKHPINNASSAALDRAADPLAQPLRLPCGAVLTNRLSKTAMTEGACDVIGLGRPLCTEVDFVARLLSGQVTEAPRHESRLKLGSSRLLSGISPLTGIRQLNTAGSQAWYYKQIFRLADGKPPRVNLGIVSAFFRFLINEYATAFRMKRSIKRLSVSNPL